MLTVDSVGRRPLLLGGVGSIVVALLALGGAQTLLSGSAETWTSVAALLLYVGAYQASTSLLRPAWPSMLPPLGGSPVENGVCPSPSVQVYA